MERDRLVREGRLGTREASLVDLEAIARFWGSDLGREVRRRRAGMLREETFTVRMSAADLRGLGFGVDPGLADDEFVVGQGVVDLAVVDDEGIMIVDFKTDRVDRGSLTRAKAESYRPQLSVYALALSRIHGRPVTARWLHFLATGENVPV